MFKKFTKTVAILGAIMITLGVTTPKKLIYIQLKMDGTK